MITDVWEIYCFTSHVQILTNLALNIYFKEAPLWLTIERNSHDDPLQHFIVVHDVQEMEGEEVSVEYRTSYRGGEE